MMNPPKHLSPESKKTWRRVVEEYDLGPDAEMLLQTALEQYDRLQQARKHIAEHGIVIDGKRNPACDVEKTAAGLFLRGLRQLGLDIAPAGPVGRPASSV